jgi:hypothetical protein
VRDPVALLTLLACASICLRLITYRRSPGARYRPWVSACAWLLIVCSGGQAIHIALGHAVPGETTPWQLGILLVLAALLLAARGNLARVLRLDA